MSHGRVSRCGMVVRIFPNAHLHQQYSLWTYSPYHFPNLKQPPNPICIFRAYMYNLPLCRSELSLECPRITHGITIIAGASESNVSELFHGCTLQTAFFWYWLSGNNQVVVFFNSRTSHLDGITRVALECFHLHSGRCTKQIYFRGWQVNFMLVLFCLTVVTVTQFLISLSLRT